MSWVFIDRTAEAAAHAVGSTRPQGIRNIADVDAIILHQTGFTRGSNVTSYDATNAHFVILPDGATIKLHEPTTLLHASNGFNRRSVAVEFVGNFPNSRGSWWRPRGQLTTYARRVTYGHHDLSWEQVSAGRNLVVFVYIMYGVRNVFTHRQASSPRKGNCAGPHIWYNVGEYSVTQTVWNLTDGGAGYCLADGEPIPASWRDPGLEISPPAAAPAAGGPVLTD